MARNGNFFRKKNVRKAEGLLSEFLLGVQNGLTGRDDETWVPIWVRLCRHRQRLTLQPLLKIQDRITKSPTPTNLVGDLRDILTGVPPLETSFPESIRNAQGNRVGWKCEVCGKRHTEEDPLEPHHKVLRSLNGRHTAQNILLLCIQCHYRLHWILALFLVARGAPKLIKDRMDKRNGKKKRPRKKK